MTNPIYKTPILVTGSLTPTGTQDVSIVSPTPLPTGAATEATLLTLETDVGKNYGVWSYYSGINGTVAVTTGQRVVGIAAYAALGGTLTINGGATITIPIGVSINIEPKGNLVAPTIIFSGTSTYFIEVVS